MSKEKNKRWTVHYDLNKIPPTRISHSNKRWEERLTEKMWDKCPECNSDKNFVKKEWDNAIGTTVIIQCSDCGHKEDITPYEMW